jgi:hypothetical protein
VEKTRENASKRVNVGQPSNPATKMSALTKRTFGVVSGKRNAEIDNA